MNDLSPEDRLVLDRLLTQLAGRLDGAIDFWTLVCLGHFPPDPREFILKNGDTMRALVIVTRGFLGSVPSSRARPIHDLLDRMAAACQKLQNAFLVLEQFRAVPLEEVRLATQAVAEVYGDLHESIRQFGEAVGLSISYWHNRKPERNEYFRKILDGLFNTFAHERETGALAASLTSVKT